MIRSLSRPWVPAVFALMVALPCLAPVARADEAGDWTALIALRKQIGDETFRTQPAQAVAQLQEFYQSRTLDPVLAAEVGLQIAEITDTQLNKPDEARKMLDAGLDGARAAHDPKKPVEVMYLDGLAGLLMRQKQNEEALALLKADRPMIVDGARSGHPHLEQFASRALNRWADALDAQSAPPQESVTLLENALGEMPTFLDPQKQEALDWHQGWMYERLVAKESESGKFERALSWGKLFWAEAPYDQASIERATKALTGVWAAQGEFKSVLVFTRAQLPAKDGEAAAVNPLAGVAFPGFEADSPVRSDLAQLRQIQRNGPWRGRVAPIITLEIALQEWAPAMKRAQELLLSDPVALDGPAQIARVFKARDASVLRANGFLAYLNGHAPNPLPAFFEGAGATG